jgi:adenylate kinase family enzyme
VASRIVLFSGHVSSGKTTVSKELVRRFNLLHIRSVDILTRLHPETLAERGAMQLHW